MGLYGNYIFWSVKVCMEWVQILKKCKSQTIKTKITDMCFIVPCDIGIYTRKNCFRYLKLKSPLNASICTTISYSLWVEWYYLKNNYLTLRSKVKVPRRSLWYTIHRLMVMHPHTKYNWPIWKDKKVMVRTSFAEKKRKKKSD